MTIPPGDLIPRPVVDEMVAKLQAQVDESKRVIAALLRQIHGPRAEPSASCWTLKVSN